MGVMENIVTATIASGQSLSAAVYLGAGTLATIQMPAAWTAAVLTFQSSPDGVTYTNLYDASGTEYSVTVSTSRSVQLPVADFQGLRWLKVRSGTAAAAVAQGADRALVLVAPKLRTTA